VHAYLFSGPRGTGKTSMARILAKAVNCLDPDLSARPCDHCEHCKTINQGQFLDLIEIDAASNTSVEDVRDLRDKINFSPNQGRYKVYIIDEVHMLSTAAFNALLKTLEEPPPHAIFVLATTEVHKIPATVLSRCQRHEFRRIPVVVIVDQLKRIVNGENLKAEPEALNLIARQATGSMRDAISLLDQLASVGGIVTLELAEKVLGTVANQSVLDVIDALLVKDTALGLSCIHRALDAGSDPRLFARQIVDYLRSLILSKMGNINQIDTTAEVKAQIIRHHQMISTRALLLIIRNFNQAASDIRGSWQPALPLELAFIDSVAGELDNDKQGGDSQSKAPVITSNRPLSNDQTIPISTEGTVASLADIDTISQTTGQEVSFKRINELWRKFSDLVGQQSKQTQALLNSCKPFGVQEKTLFLGFNGDFAKSKMEHKENLELAQAILGELLGVRIALRCFVVSSHQGGLPPEVESDGMVATALRDLGGEIVDIQ